MKTASPERLPAIEGAGKAPAGETMARNDPKGWKIFQHAGPIELTTLRVEDVNIHDIAHGLNGINRFIGQTGTRYRCSGTA